MQRDSFCSWTDHSWLIAGVHLGKGGSLVHRQGVHTGVFTDALTIQTTDQY